MTCAGNQVDPGGLGPDFIGGVRNVTVPEGRDVILSCTVVRLGTHKVSNIRSKACYDYKSYMSKLTIASWWRVYVYIASQVAWIHYDRSAILTVQNNVITRNPRIGVSHDGHSVWNLHIR